MPCPSYYLNLLIKFKQFPQQSQAFPFNRDKTIQKKPEKNSTFQRVRSEATQGVRGSSPGQPLGAAAEAAGENGFKSNRPDGRRSSGHKKIRAGTARIFDVWMTGLEPATSWSLTRCATNCATSRGPFFKGTANIGILFRKNKRKTTYFSEVGVVRVSCRAFSADLRAEEARMRRMGPLTTAKVFMSSFRVSGEKEG